MKYRIDMAFKTEMSTDDPVMARAIFIATVATLLVKVTPDKNITDWKMIECTAKQIGETEWTRMY